jgi:ATP-dependent RNA circularization protein (DNA/RNA ligase family)
MKPAGRKNYGSIPHLSCSKLGSGDYFIGEGQENILTKRTRDKEDNILVFEKYDGSNVGITKTNGKIFALTRSGYKAITSKYIQHHYFSFWVEKREKIFQELLQEGERITGEWLAQAHGLVYKIENEPIVFFDYFTKDNNRVLFEELVIKANRFELQLPRKLHEGQAISVTDVLPTLNLKTKEIESQELPEGMVFRVERQGKVDFLAKYVRHDFQPGKFCIGVEDKDLVWNVPLTTLQK